MAKTDPAGKEYKPADYVFGELGKQVNTSKRAWDTCVVKAHGHDPVWLKTALAPASRTALKAIDLHFHDLRHEGGSRLLEAGWPIHHVQEMLGHASLEQTSTYLNVRQGGLRESMRKLDAIRGLARRYQLCPLPRERLINCASLTEPHDFLREKGRRRGDRQRGVHCRA
jgi:integrase